MQCLTRGTDIINGKYSKCILLSLAFLSEPESVDIYIANVWMGGQMSPTLFTCMWMQKWTTKTKSTYDIWMICQIFPSSPQDLTMCLCIGFCMLWLKTVRGCKEVYLGLLCVHFCWYYNVLACVSDSSRGENTVTARTRRKDGGGNETNCDISWFWQAPCHVWCTSASPHVALYMKLVLFSISSLFKCGAGAAWRGGCRALRVGWNWTASTHYCKHHPARQASRLQGRRMSKEEACLEKIC